MPARALLVLALVLAAACQEADGGDVGGGGADVNAECLSASDCAIGLRCHRRTCIGADHLIGHVGDGCSVSAHCAVPLVCVAGACTEVDPGGGQRGSVERTDGSWPTPASCDLEYPYGFVSLITGPVAVVDLCSCNRDGEGRLARLSEIGEGHFITHGVGVDRARKEVWYGNQDHNSVERLRVSDDLSTFEVLAEVRIAGGLSTIRRSPNGRYVGVGAAEPQMVPMVLDEFAKNRAQFIDSGLNTVVGIAQTESPGAIFFSGDSETAWIPDINHRLISEVKMADLALPDTPVHREIALPWPEDKPDLIGPAPFLDQTQDFRWIAIPGLDAEAVWVFDTESGWEDWWQYDTPGERPHMVAWTPDGARLWITTFTRWPEPAKEDENPNIPSYVHVVDAVTHERIRRFQWKPGGKPTAVWHVEITPDGRTAWLSGSYGSVVGVDLETFEPRCSVSLSAGPRPAMTLDY